MSYRPHKYGYPRCTFGALPQSQASQIRHHVSPGFPPTSSKTSWLRETYIGKVLFLKKHDLLETSKLSMQSAGFSSGSFSLCGFSKYAIFWRSE